MNAHFVVPSVVVLVPLAVAAAAVVARAMARDTGAQHRRRVLLAAVSAVYGLGVLAVTILPIQVNLGKYRSMNAWYADLEPLPLITADPRSFVLNVVMLMPLGMLLPALNPDLRSVRSVLRLGAAVSLGIEVTQFALGRLLDSRHSVDINDLIANTLGAVVGYLVLRAALRRPSIAAWLTPAGH